MPDRIDALLAEMAEFALRYPEVNEGLSCAGTAIESRTVLTGKRAFVFLRHKEVRMRVADALPEVAELAAAHPDQYEAGKGGWIKITLEAGADPSPDQWKRWMDESFRLMATKTRIRKLEAAPLICALLLPALWGCATGQPTTPPPAAAQCKETVPSTPPAPSIPAAKALPADAKVTGIGGVFFKVKDGDTLRAWYEQHLGIKAAEWGGKSFIWREGHAPAQRGYTVWGPTKHDTKYFDPSDSSLMINYRVADMDRLVDQLEKAGIELVGEVQTEPNGKFAWVLDPEGNKLELWEPVDSAKDPYLPKE